ncbi:hypothetical protein AGMMS50239_13570 [Bacteroidia bacterium]|nr:hypothetical protein AGMMS50239_13570 [Bacteroidia bacterium]
MNKGKNFNGGHIMVETLSASIASLLLTEGKVVIPELGYLELKVFPDKRTVLFKATENMTLFLASEGSIQSHIYNNISVPLKEGKVVTLPEVGIFRPIKNGDGSYRISYTISSAFRKLLNDAKENEIEAEKPEVPVTLVQAEDEKPLISDVELAIEKQSVEKEKEVKVSVPRQEARSEIKVDRKTTPSYVRNTSKVGDLVVPQEERESNVTRMSGIIVAIAVLIAVVLIAWYFIPGSKNKRNNYAFVAENNKKALLTGQSKESTKFYKSIDLPSLAEQKYGNRMFWVYIYEANRDKISSPVNIPTGTDLRLPDLWEDYKVDVMDSMEIKRAGILSDRMLKPEGTTLKK